MLECKEKQKKSERWAREAAAAALFENEKTFTVAVHSRKGLTVIHRLVTTAPLALNPCARYSVFTFLLQLVVDLLEDGRELLAGGAPTGAEVHRQHLPVESLRADLGAVRLTNHNNNNNNNNSENKNNNNNKTDKSAVETRGRQSKGV